MASSDRTPRGMSRRFVYLAFGIVLAIAAYSYGWTYVAAGLETQAARFIQLAQGRGVEAACTNAEARGYPFRIGLFCDGVGYTDRGAGLSVSGTGLRSAAQIYQPRRIVGELDTLSVALAPSRERPSITVSVSDLRYSARIADPIPERASVVGAVLRAETDGAQLLSANGSALHMRQVGPDVDLAGSLTGVTLIAAGLDAVFNADLDLRALDGATRIARGLDGLRGTRWDIRSLRVAAEGAEARLAGNLSVDADGLVDGTLTVDLTNTPVLLDLIGKAAPAWKPQLDASVPVVAALGSSPSLPLTIRKGVVTMGFIGLGTIPPLN